MIREEHRGKVSDDAEIVRIILRVFVILFKRLTAKAKQPQTAVRWIYDETGRMQWKVKKSESDNRGDIRGGGFPPHLSLSTVLNRCIIILHRPQTGAASTLTKDIRIIDRVPWSLRLRRCRAGTVTCTKTLWSCSGSWTWRCQRIDLSQSNNAPHTYERFCTSTRPFQYTQRKP